MKKFMFTAIVMGVLCFTGCDAKYYNGNSSSTVPSSGDFLANTTWEDRTWGVILEFTEKSVTWKGASEGLYAYKITGPDSFTVIDGGGEGRDMKGRLLDGKLSYDGRAWYRIED